MPRGDGTGPKGSGAISGRGAGFCSGFDMPGYANSAIQEGQGRARALLRRGRCGPKAGGRGWRRGGLAFNQADRMYAQGYAAPRPLDPEVEKQTLANRIQALQSELDAVNRRLGEIDAGEPAT